MRFVGYLLAVLGIAGPALAINNTTSRIYVHIPFQIHNATGFEHVQAEFGFEHSVGSLSEFVYFLDDHLCSPLEFNKTRGFPAHEHGLQPPFILMAKDGTCSAVTKARHAQQVGASALVIMDAHCRCGDQKCTDRFPKDICQDVQPTLVNDGSGSDISIPSFLIYKGLAVTLADNLRKDQPVLMELVWGLKADVDASDTLPLKYHLWTTAHDPLVDLETYTNLRTVAKAFEGKAVFEPRYSIIDGTRFKCNESPEEDGPCDHLCTNHGRYCAVHAKNLSGYAIVKETLRRLCIWKHHSDTSDIWWDYVLYHKEHCSEPHQYASDDCIQTALKHAKVDETTVKQCTTDTGDVDQDLANSLLDEMVVKQKHSSVVSLPAITINRKVLDHASSWSLFDTVCFEYWMSNSVSVPKVCTTCGSCPNKIGCLKKGHCVDFSDKERHPSSGGGDSGSKKSSRHHGWRIFWFLTICLIIGGAYYYYKQRDEFGGRGNPLQGYLQLSGEG